MVYSSSALYNISNYMYVESLSYFLLKNKCLLYGACVICKERGPFDDKPLKSNVSDRCFCQKTALLVYWENYKRGRTQSIRIAIYTLIFVRVSQTSAFYSYIFERRTCISYLFRVLWANKTNILKQYLCCSVV